MKKIIFPILFAIAFVSCKKDSESPSLPQGFIRYKQNGVLVTFDNKNQASGQAAVIVKHLAGAIPATRYGIDCTKGDNIHFGSTIVADSLKPGTYFYDSVKTVNDYARYGATVSLIDSRAGLLIYSTDYISFNITTNDNGVISGTFEARLTPITVASFNYADRGTTIITEGEINSIKVTY